MSAAVMTPTAASPAPDAPAIPASTLRLAGPEGWIGRLLVEREISDVVVLRPLGNNDKEAPLVARQHLARLSSDAAAVKRIAVAALLDARSSIPATPGSLLGWRIVELRIDRDGRAWVGLYETGYHETWMVELDETGGPSSIWRRQKRDVHNLADCGSRLR